MPSTTSTKTITKKGAGSAKQTSKSTTARNTSKSVYVLGLACYYHDASACIIKDGVVIAAAEEERFTRKKHDFDFPIKAAQYCLAEAGITIKDVASVAFYEKPLLKFERLVSQHLQMFPRSYWAFAKAMPPWLTEKLRVQSAIRKKLKYTGDVMYVEHHLAHAASSYLVSPFSEAAIFTADGVGEWETTTYGYAKGNDITLTHKIDFPHSLGLLYSAVTAHLGMSVNNSEYKIMGMAPYGNPKYVEKFRKVIDIKDDGSFQIDMSYFVYHYKLAMPGPKFVKEFGPIRKPESEITQHHKDIAASLQKITEEAMIKALRHIHAVTGSRNICLSGGVALNSVANGKLLRETPFKDMYIIPPAGDGGASVGAAAYAYFSALKHKRTAQSVMRTAYLGPGFTDEEVEQFLKDNKIVYSKFSSHRELVTKTAKLIHDNNVIGWMQGRMEFGPRALGARSILSNACNPKMKDILNTKVKHREKFRPFAPVVCVEDANTYFECDKPIPLPTDFMLMVYPVRKEHRAKIPAVTHVDGSGRLQTVRREQNPAYYDVIKAFGKLSGTPILINTSFNIRGEPIVCTPYDAYKCMMGTGIDYLVMENFLISREENARDKWDSERYAKD